MNGKYFQNKGFSPGLRVSYTSKSKNVYPKECEGVIEEIHDRYMIIQSDKGYRVTVNKGEIVIGEAKVLLVNKKAV